MIVPGSGAIVLLYTFAFLHYPTDTPAYNISRGHVRTTYYNEIPTEIENE